jgi:hemerythrin
VSQKIEPIAWSPALVTGIAAVDEQHQILVNMLNEANERLTASTGREVLLEIVRDLIAYALYHFDEEEELMLAKGYPADMSARHTEEHRLFSEKVSSIQQELMQGKLIGRDDLLGYLNQWLVNHIMVTDQQLGHYIRALDSLPG